MNLEQELQDIEEKHLAGEINSAQFELAKQVTLKKYGEHATAASVPPPPNSKRASTQPPPLYESSPTETHGPIVDERVMRWAIVLHLSLMLTVIAPMIIWSIAKEDMPEISRHGRRVTNWGLSYIIYILPACLLSAFLVGIPLLIALLIMYWVFPIVGAMKAADGVAWSYPFAIRFFSEREQ